MVVNTCARICVDGMRRWKKLEKELGISLADFNFLSVPHFNPPYPRVLIIWTTLKLLSAPYIYALPFT